MAHVCQLTEIPIKDFPELFQFYRYFPKKYPFLLSTTSQNNAININSSFDILFIEPKEWLKLDHALQLSASSQYDINPEISFLDNFDQVFNLEKNTANIDSLKEFNLPFSGGWFVYFSYELAQQIEPCLKLPLFDKTEQALPIAYAARVRSALIFDHKNNKLFFISEADVDHSQSLKKLMQDVQFINEQSDEDDLNDICLINGLEEEIENTFIGGAKKVKDYIKEGDVFQVNLSRCWQTSILQNNKNEKTKEDISNLSSHFYKLLSKANPAPFSGIAQFSSEQGDVSIISSSPERLLKVKNNQLESRPIAGTRPRSESMEEDLRLIEELHQHPKEQAEHIMLIDLIRNDLGKVCIPGTVSVDELMVNETYAHVHHIVSNVIGQLQEGVAPGEIIKALFPGGTITGCPKVRCMEIIAELEKQARGAYTGSMGYINLDGSMDLNILIRSMVLQKQISKQYQLSFRAGAGLVYDSIAEKELQETRDKAVGLIRALQ